MKGKKEMMRVLKTPEGPIVLDMTGRKNGRGAYLCRNLDCLKKAENTLEHMEKELGLLRNSLRLERLLDRLRELKLPEVDELIAQFKQASEDDNGI